MIHKPQLKLAAFDMDGTVTVARSSWEYLHRRLGIWEGQAEKYQELFLAGKISYEEFCRLDAAMWKGMSVNDTIKILNEIPLQSGVKELMKLIKRTGAVPVLLSTGLKLLADQVARHLGFRVHLANELIHRDGRLTGDIAVRVSTHSPGETKACHMRKLMLRFGVSPPETVAVGDSAGDLEMFREAGLAIAVNPREKDLGILRAAVPGLVVVKNLDEVAGIIKNNFSNFEN